MRAFSRIAVALLAALAAGTALADDYQIRVPVASATADPTIQTVDYGSIVLNTPTPKTLTYTNTTAQAQTLGLMAVSGKPVTITANGCANGTSVAAGQSCSFKVTVNPTATGRWDTAISLPVAGVTAAPQFIVRALGVSPNTVLLFDRSSVEFGGQTLQTATAPQTLTLKNYGSEAVTVASVRLGENTNYFTFDGSDCERELAPAATCKVTAALTPRYLGTVSARVLVELEDGSLFQGASLTGYGVQGVPTFSASKINFIGVRVGQTSAPQTLTLSNTGTGTFGINSLALSGDGSFKMASNDCGKSMAMGSTCSMSFTVSPDTADIRSATVTLDASGVATQTTRVYLFSQPAVAQGVLEVTPTAMSFGDVAVGSTSTLDLTLRSTGTLPVVVSQYVFSGTAANQFTLVNPNTCVGTLNAGQQCTTQVRVAPKAAGALSAALTLTTDLTTPLAPLSLSANGLVGTLTAAPTSLSFTDVQTGKSASQTVTLTNSGTASLTIGQRSVSPVTLSVSGCEQATLAPNASCTATVTYTPVGAGNATGGVTFPNNGAPSSLVLPVSMTATPAPTPKASLGAFVCTPTPVQTGRAATCVASLSNVGTVPVSVGAFSRTGTVFSAPTSTCGTSLAVGASCAVTTTVTSSTVGAQSTSVSVTTDAGAQTGTAAADFQAAALSLTTAPHGIVQVGASNVRAHTVANNSPFPVTVNVPATLTSAVGLSLGGTPASGTACVNGGTLTTGQSCVVTTTCTPTAAASLTSTLSLTSTANTVTGAVTCQGEFPPVSGSALSFTPNPLDWGNVSVGSTAQMTATLKNTSAAPLTVSAMTLGGTSAADFTMVTNGCLKSLAAGSTCQVTLQAKPSAAGTEAATLSVSANTTTAVTPLTLRVTGAQANLALAPASANFGTVQVGQTASATFVLRNTGTGSATLTGLTFGGTDAARFSFSGNTCTAGGALSAGTSCVINVVFTPTTVGAANAEVRLTASGASVASLVASLTGTGAPAPAPVLAASLGSDCQTHVQFGQASACTITLANNGTTGATVTGYTERRTQGDFSAGTAAASRVLANARAFTALAGGASINTAGALVLPAGASAKLVDTVTAIATSTVSVDSYFSFSGKHVNTYSFTTTPTVAVTADASHFVDAPALTVTTPTPDLSVQMGDSRTAIFTLTNQGIGPVSLGTSVATFQLGSGSAIFRVAAPTTGACVAGQTLTPGQSCQSSVVCAPLATSVKSAGSISFNAFATLSGGVSKALVAKGALSCSPVPASATITPVAPGRTTAVATGSQSGNWLRFTNTGSGPQTITALTADPQTVFYTDPSNAAHCAVNRVVASGGTCDFLEMVVKENPASTPLAVTTKTSYLRTNLMTLPIASSYTVTGLALVTQGTANAKIQKGEVRDIVVAVQNTSPSAASALTFTPSSNVKVKSTTCETVQPNASCLVTLTLSPPTTLAGTTMLASLRVDAKFERLYNTSRYPASVSSQGGNWSTSFTLTTPSATLAVTSPADTNVNKQTTATATFTNTGAGPLNVTNPVFTDVTTGGAVPYSVSLNGCNTPVAPSTSCTMTLQFAPKNTGIFTAKFAVTSEATTVPGQVSAKAFGPGVEPWGRSVGVCGGWGWGFDQNGNLQCNVFGVAKYRALGYVNTDVIDTIGETSKYYLTPPAAWQMGATDAKALDIYTYPDVSLPCGYYNEYYRTRQWSDREMSGPGPIITASNGVKYSFSTCTGHDTPPYSTINIRYQGSLLVALNPDGTVRYTRGVGGMDTSRLPQPYDDMGAAYDEARDTIFMGGLYSGETNRYNGVIYRVQASTGQVVSSWPTSQYGSVFAYDRVTGDLYFGQGTYYLSSRGAVTATALLRVNPYTGATATIALPRSINLTRAGHRFYAYNGKVYLLEVASTGNSLIRIDTTVSPARLDTLAGGPGFTNVMLSNSYYLTQGGPGDNSLYAPSMGVRIPLN